MVQTWQPVALIEPFAVLQKKKFIMKEKLHDSFSVQHAVIKYDWSMLTHGKTVL